MKNGIFLRLALVAMAAMIGRGAMAEETERCDNDATETAEMATEDALSVAETAAFISEMRAVDTEKAEEKALLLPSHYRSHHPRWQSFALPAGIGVGASLFATNGWLRQRRNDLQDWLDTSHQKKAIDNYVQYLPIATMYGLKACGVKSEHNLLHQTGLLAMSALTVAVIVNGVKYTVKEPRPDGSRHNSFPSGHTATAFMGAEMLFQEYRDVSPWIGYGGYFVAGMVGCLRIYNNRHWMNDVVAGACVGIISTKLAYWLYPKIFSVKACRGGQSASICPVVGDGGCSLCVALNF